MVENQRRSEQMSLPPKGFYLYQDVVDEKYWHRLVSWLKKPTSRSAKVRGETSTSSIPWEVATEGRDVVQFGFRYDYDSQCVDVTPVEPIPPILQELLSVSKQILARSACGPNEPDDVYTQCIINYYGAQHDIPWHIDDASFGPKVLVFTFGEDRPLKLRRKIHTSGNKSIGQEHNLQGSAIPADEIEENMQSTRSSYEYHTAFPKHLSMYLLTGDARNDWEHCVARGHSERVSVTFRSLREMQQDE